MREKNTRMLKTNKEKRNIRDFEAEYREDAEKREITGWRENVKK